MINQNNRPSIVIPLAAISADIEVPAWLADKKARVRGAKFVQSGAITASGTNYLTLQLKQNNVAVGAAVDTQLGLPAREGLALGLGALEYLELELGDYLSLDVVESGTFAEGASGLLVLDIEVLGN